jgi:hypothetical protein
MEKTVAHDFDQVRPKFSNKTPVPFNIPGPEFRFPQSIAGLGLRQKMKPKAYRNPLDRFMVESLENQLTVSHGSLLDDKRKLIPSIRRLWGSGGWPRNEEVRRMTGHSANKAFDRYVRLEGDPRRPFYARRRRAADNNGPTMDFLGGVWL